MRGILWPYQGAETMTQAAPPPASQPASSHTTATAARGGHAWHHQARRRLRHSLRWRLVTLFLLLAIGVTVAFLGGMQKALSVGWRDAGRPLVSDYVDRLVADIGSPPDVARAQDLVRRLPLSVHIEGPAVNWDSHPERHRAAYAGHASRDGTAGGEGRWLERRTADGHLVRFGLGDLGWEGPPRLIGGLTLLVLLLLTALAYAYVHHLLKPLADIRQGVERFAGGDFAHPIPVRRRDELGDLAHRINHMAQELQQMLDAKRSLLLSISHELRSPLTRARLNVELLPDNDEVRGLREALLRDMAAMRDLIGDLLESERLASRHAVLNREPTDLATLVDEVLSDLERVHQVTDSDVGAAPAAQPMLPVLDVEPQLPQAIVDRVRVRLLVRNLLDNAIRHSVGSPVPPLLHLGCVGPDIELQVRDHGPGVTEAQLPLLAQPFYRTDAARQRATGGVGLGLYLSRLVVQAHGGSWAVRNAHPGLEITVTLPRHRV